MSKRERREARGEGRGSRDKIKYVDCGAVGNNCTLVAIIFAAQLLNHRCSSLYGLMYSCKDYNVKLSFFACEKQILNYF